MNHSDLPTFEAAWWPLVLETVPGGTERIVIGTIARSASGQSQVRQVIPPATLNAMFASAGKGMQLVVGTTVLGIQQQLDAGVRVEDVSLPFGGVHVGEERDCVAHDFNEVFDIAVRLTSAFGVSNFGVRETVTPETQLAFDDWALRVREHLAMSQRRLELEGMFNVRVQLAARKNSHIGFLFGGYAANFGVLRPGHGSADTRALKVKVFDIGAYRRMNKMTVTRAEVIIGCPQLAGDSAFSSREVEGLESSWQFIADESRARGIEPVRCVSAQDAAAHIERMAA
jgi:hypothetical protein